jgi:hypothetical protein
MAREGAGPAERLEDPDAKESPLPAVATDGESITVVKDEDGSARR